MGKMPPLSRGPFKTLPCLRGAEAIHEREEKVAGGKDKI
jgi:hypothetical protein